MLRRLVNTFSWTAAAGAVRLLLGFSYAGLTVRWIGEAGAGIVWTIGGLHTVASALIGGGMIMAGTREISREPRNGLVVVNAVGGQFIVLSLIVLCCTPLFYVLSRNSAIQVHSPALIWVISVGFSLNRIVTVLISFLRAGQRYDIVGKIMISYDILLLLITALVMKETRDSVVYALVFSGVNAVSLAMALWAVSITLGAMPTFRMSLGTLRKLWPFGRWVYLTNVFGSLSTGLDRSLVAAQFGADLLPIYSLPKRFYETFHTLLSQQTLNLFTLTAAQPAAGATELNRRKELLLWFFSLVGTFGYTAIIGFGPRVISLLTGLPLTFDTVLAVVAFASVGWFQTLLIPIFHVLYAEGRSGFLCIVSILSGTLAIIGLVVLGRLFGVRGTFFCELGTIGIAMVAVARFLPGAGRFGAYALRQVGLPFCAYLLQVVIALLAAAHDSIWILQLYTAAFLLLGPPLLLRAEATSSRGRGNLTVLTTAIAHSSLLKGPPMKLLTRWLGIRRHETA